MSRASRHRPRPAAGRSRLVAAAALALGAWLLLAQAWGLHHAVTTAHVVCDEHGEPTHLEGEATLSAHFEHLARHAAGAPHEQPRLGHDEDGHGPGHEHCTLVELQRDGSESLAGPATTDSAPPPAVLVGLEPRRSPQRSVARLPESARGPPTSPRA